MRTPTTWRVQEPDVGSRRPYPGPVAPAPDAPPDRRPADVVGTVVLLRVTSVLGVVAASFGRSTAMVPSRRLAPRRSVSWVLLVPVVAQFLLVPVGSAVTTSAVPS